MTSSELLEGVYSELRDSAARSSYGFLRGWVIDSYPEPRAWGILADPWQKDIASKICPIVDHVAGKAPGYTGPLSAWLVLPRGHDKSSLVSRLLLWAGRYSERRLSASVSSGDEEQARILIEKLQAELPLNPWIPEEEISVGRKRVAFEDGGKIDILTSDAATTYGRTDDLMLVEEITHWKKRELWDAIVSGRFKKPHSGLLVVSNAGIVGSWQHKLFLEAKASPDKWVVVEAPGMIASWLRKDEIEDMRKLLPPVVARRLLDNQWVNSAEEGGYLTAAAIDSGADSSLIYTPFAVRKDYSYWAGIDYGPKKDRTALCVLHLREDRVVVVDVLDVWQGSEEDRVKVAAVDSWIERMAYNFEGKLSLVVDPYQMEGIIQKWEPNIRVERWEGRGGKRNYEMAACLRALLEGGRLKWYVGAGTITGGKGTAGESLEDELKGLVIKNTPDGYRFDHKSGHHDDRAVSLGMAALYAARDTIAVPWVGPRAPLRKKEGRPIFGVNF